MKSFYPHQKFKKARSVIALAVVIIVAIVFMAVGVTLALVDQKAPLREVTSIEFLSEKLGASANFDKVYVRIIYNNNTSEEVPLSQLLPTGIDATREGLQNAVLSFGNKEYIVPVTVVLTNIKINYVASGVGGNILGDLSQRVPAGESGSEVEAVPLEGYHFKEWSDGATNPIRHEKSVSNDTTLRAIFERNVFIVTFMAADGTSVEQKVSYGDAALPIPDTDSRLKKYGYVFQGWDNAEWKKVTKDITVKPVMRAIKSAYEVYVSALLGEPMGTKKITDTNIETDSLNGKNDWKGMEGAEYAYKGYYQWNLDGAVSMTPAVGKVFDCWEIYGRVADNGAFQWNKVPAGSDVQLWLPDATERVHFVADNNAENPYLGFKLATGTSLLRVRAVYAKANSTITFRVNNEVQKTVALPFKAFLTATDLQAPAPILGNRFLGWFVETDTVNKVEPTHAPFYVDTVLVARFERIDITITFQTEAGGAFGSATATFGSMVANELIPSPTQKPNYRFLRWNVTECAGNPALVGTSFTAETIVSYDITVRPVYERITFDMAISIVGQGAITCTNQAGEAQTVGSHMWLLAGETYTFNFNPASGYSLANYVLEMPDGTSSSGTGALTLANLQGNRKLVANFAPQNHTVTISNGVVGTTGTIAILTNTYLAQSFTVPVLHGMPLKVGITAPQNKKITSILVQGTEKLPAGEFAQYTLIYDGEVNADIAIVIVYGDLNYEVYTTVGVGGSAVLYQRNTDGSFSAEASAANYAFRYGTSLKLEITADAGKYISSLKMWGKSIDLYQYYYESFSDALYQNGDPYFFTNREQKGFTQKDKRVTKIILYLPSPNKVTAISLDFADILYSINTTSVGNGEVRASANAVKAGGSATLTLQTDVSYVVLGYQLTKHSSATPSSEWIEIKDNNNSAVLTFDRIAEDIEVEVHFGKRTYGILFYELAEVGSSYNILVDGTVDNININHNKSFTLFHGDSKTYQLQAAQGYLIAQIQILDGHGAITPSGTIMLPPNTANYDLVFNNVAGAYGVKVTLAKQNFEVSLVTNLITSQIGKITFSPSSVYGNNIYPQDAPGGASSTVFSYAYGTDVTVVAELLPNFSIALFEVDGVEVLGAEGKLQHSATFALTKNITLRISAKFASGTAGTPIISDSIPKNEGTVTYQLIGSENKVIYKVEPKAGYELKALYINDVQVAVDQFGQYTTTYTATSVHFVTAIFALRKIPLQFSVAHGAVTADKDYVLYGEPTKVYFVADTGYQLESVKINGKPLSAQQIADILASNGIFYQIPATETQRSVGSAVTVSANFKALPYNFSGSMDPLGSGAGRVTMEDGSALISGVVRYGNYFTFLFMAAEGSYISTITINGTAIELSSLTDAVVKTSNGKYASGKYSLKITGDTTMVVRFENDVFRVTVTEAANGATTLSQSSRGNNEYNATETVTVSMNATDGYHVKALYINGLLQDLILFSTDNLNLNVTLHYYIPTALMVQNLVVRAEYEHNSYNIKVTIQNVSPNFKGVDAALSTYTRSVGMRLNGATLDSTTDTDILSATSSVLFRQIEHGGTPVLTLAPDTTKGYEFESATITYRPSFGAAANTLEIKNYFTEENGYTSTLPSVYWDITDFTVVLKRKVVQFAVPQRVSVGARDAITVQPTFYSTGKTVATPAREKAANVYFYEYGVRAELLIKVTEGYRISKFLVDGVSQIINDKGESRFELTLNKNITIEFGAEVIMVTLKLSSSGSTGTGVANFSGYDSTVTTLTVEYGKNISILIIANYEVDGSYIKEFYDGTTLRPLLDDQKTTVDAFATVDTTFRIVYAIRSYWVHLGTNYPTLDEGIQGVQYNGSNESTFLWGTARIEVRIELMPGYDLTALTQNTIAVNNFVKEGNYIVFSISNIRENQSIVALAEKKRFTASTPASASGVTTFYKNGLPEPLAGVVGNISYGDRLQIKLYPEKNYYAVSYAVKMKDLSGIIINKTYLATNPNAANTDIFMIEIERVTGDVVVEVNYAQKEYHVSIVQEGPLGKIENINPYVKGGDTLNINITTVNTKDNLGVLKYYNDIASITINGYEYYTEKVALNDWGTVAFQYRPSTKDARYEYRFIASDVIMNGSNALIGSGENRELNIKIVMDKNRYYADEIVVKNQKTNQETTFPIGENSKEVGDEYVQIGVRGLRGQYDGTTTAVSFTMKNGYSPISIKAKVFDGTTHTERFIRDRFDENIGTTSVTIPASVDIADVSNPYRKKLHLVVVVDINKYTSEFSVYTNEENGQTVSIGQNLRGVSAKLNGAATTDAALSKIDHNGLVEVTAGGTQGYSFRGYEQYNVATARWEVAQNLTDKDGNRIVLISGITLSVTVVQNFRFRAVYDKQVAIDVVIAPLHKYISGTYVSDNGAGVVYSMYANLIVTVGGVVQDPISKNNGVYKFVFLYNDEVLIEAKDTRSGQNNSSRAVFYLQNGEANPAVGGQETVLESIGVVNSFQLRFRALKNHQYNADVLANNDAIYVVFDNVVKLQSSTNTLGGKTNTDGGIVTYEVKSSGTNNSYSPLSFYGKTANVKIFDRVRITIKVNDGYRFEGFSRYQANRTEQNLIFANRMQSFGQYNALGLGNNNWEVVKNEVFMRESRMFNLTKSTKDTVDTIVIEFAVTDNSIYRIDFVKVFGIDAFVSAPRYEGDSANTTKVNIAIKANNKSFFNTTDNTGKIDYGAIVALSLPPAADELKVKAKWQFISWYVNGVPVSGGGQNVMKFYVDYEDEGNVQLDATNNFASTDSTQKTIKIYAEFLPIYNIATHEYYKVTIDGKEASLSPTLAFSMAGYYYAKDAGIPLSQTETYVQKEVYLTQAYLPFEAKKGGGGAPSAAKDINTIHLKLTAANSYSIVGWRMFYGDYNSTTPNHAGGVQVAANQSSYDFKMTQAVYATLLSNGKTAQDTITIVPIFEKQNALQVTKAVFAEEFGRPSTTGRDLNNPCRMVGNNPETIDGMIVEKYGTTVVLNAKTNSTYRFLGWFDPSEPLTSTKALYTTEEVSVVLNRTGNSYNPDNGDAQGYVHYLQARYIRQINVNVSTINISGTKVSTSSPNLLIGNIAAENKWFYGADNRDVVKYENVLVRTFQSVGGRQAVATHDVGSYLLFNLSKDKINGGFDPWYDTYLKVIDESGAVDTSVSVRRDADGMYYLVAKMDKTRSISIQYITLGKVSLTGMLDESTVSLGSVLSQTLLAQYGDISAVKTKCFEANQVSTVELRGANLIYVTLNPSNTAGVVNIWGVEKKDYQTDTIGFSLAGLASMAHGQLHQVFGLNFSGDNTALKEVSVGVTGMPFAGGGGSQARPYQISNLDQLKNINTVYGFNGNSVSNVRFIQTAAELTISAGWVAMCADGAGFNGYFDGNNKTLKFGGRMTGTQNGVFAKTSVSTLEKFVIRGTSTVEFPTNAANAGLIVAEANGTILRDFEFSGLNVNTNTNTFGLLAGSTVGGTISKISVTNLILGGSGDMKGGIVGRATNTALSDLHLIRSDNTSKTNISGKFVGGMVGLLSGASARLENSDIKGSLITATSGVGGAVGKMENGATLQNVMVVLTSGGKLTQVVSTGAMRASGNISDYPGGNDSESNNYAAGGLVGINHGGKVIGCAIKSEKTTMQNITSPYPITRPVPAVSVSGSVAGGLVGVNTQNPSIQSEIRECYVEKHAMVEILMTSIQSVSEGSDGVYGGMVGANNGLVYHCGINGGWGNRTGFAIDQVGGNTELQTKIDQDFDRRPENNPFWTEGADNKGFHNGSSVEFLYARYNGGDGGLSSKDMTTDGYLQGATFMKGHGGDYGGDDFAARGSGKTLMGGLVGRNNSSGAIINSYVGGKVVHFRRHRALTNANIYSVLGGMVGLNTNVLYSSGVFNNAVYNYVKPVTQGATGTYFVAATGGVVGASGGGAGAMRGMYLLNTAVRGVLDPYREGGHAGIDGGDWENFLVYTAAYASGLGSLNIQGYLNYARNVKISATQDCLTDYNGYRRVASLVGINPGGKTGSNWANSGSVDNGNGSIGDFSTWGADIGGVRINCNKYFTTTGPRVLNSEGAEGSGNVQFLGAYAGQYITLG